MQYIIILQSDLKWFFTARTITSVSNE